MNIALAAATPREIEPVQQYLSERLYLKGHNRFSLVLTGVGLVSTTYTLAREWREHPPDIAIQAGIGGSFHTRYEPGEVVAVEDEILGDLGVQEQDWQDVFDMRLADPDQFPYRRGSLPNPHQGLLQKTQLPLVRGLSVNQVSTDPLLIRQRYQKYHPHVESMEGAAFHHVCLLENIPFVQLRAISNRVGERDKSRWHMAEAIHNLNEALIQFINRLAEHSHS